jgi:hypothetical protein
VAVGQLSDPYEQGEQDDDIDITVSGLPSDDEPIGGREADEIADLIADDEGSFDDAVNLAGDDAGSEIEAGLHVEDEDGDEVDDGTGTGTDDEAETGDDRSEDWQPAEETEDESDGEDEIAYDLTEWEDERLDLLFDRLEEEGVGYLWDGEELFVRESDELTVDNVLEAVSHPDALNADDDEDGDAGAGLLGDLFVVADILYKEPDDNEASTRLLELDRTAEDAEAPYGLADPEWQALREKVKATADLLLTEGDIDEEAVVEAATELRTAIRPYV